MIRARVAGVLVLCLAAACSDAISATTSTNGATGGNNGTVMAACLNVCNCFTSAANINNCRDDCNRMSTAARLKVGRAFSAGGGSASFQSSIFWTSTTNHVATAACLGCLAGASCAALENGSVCLTQCQSLVPTSGS